MHKTNNFPGRTIEMNFERTWNAFYKLKMFKNVKEHFFHETTTHVTLNFLVHSDNTNHISFYMALILL